MSLAAAAALLAAATTPMAPAPARADGLRCGTHLVHEGATRAQVEALCGPPTEIAHHTILRPSTYWYRGRPIRAGDGMMEVAVELWTYNLGPHRFMRRLRFEDGSVVDIETLGYGYVPTDPPDRTAR
ncbi:MAG: DUF2845 domain-containing protein [Steroidobacteraceae bacterium]